MGEGGPGRGAARGVAQATEGTQGEEAGSQEGTQEKSIIWRRPGPVSAANVEPGSIATGRKKLKMVANTQPGRDVTGYGSRRSPGRLVVVTPPGFGSRRRIPGRL